MTTARIQRRCFTRGCAGIPTGGNWECPACKERIHAASVLATERAARRKRARELADTCTPITGGSLERVSLEVSHPPLAQANHSPSVHMNDRQYQTRCVK
jgi:hypothetical protein